jgi:tripartite-type tricarboxylate transporter receptor subunit TctC
MRVIGSNKSAAALYQFLYKVPGMTADLRLRSVLCPFAAATLRAGTARLRAARGAALRIAAALLSVAACTAAVAQSMPDSIRIIVPFSAGGGNDVFARVLARELAPKLGRPVLVENRLGAGGNIGTDVAAKATPDGSVLVLSSSGPLASNKLLSRSLPYDPEKDLAPIAFLGETPMFILVTKSSPYLRLGDLLGDARAGQVPLNFGHSGNGTIGHLTLELLRANSRRAINDVPYKGGTQVVADILSQVLDGGVGLYTASSLAHARNGTLRILAVTSDERLASALDIPTVVEEGFPQLRSSTWFALVGPKGMPRAFIERVNREVNAYLTSPAGETKLQELGLYVQAGAPEIVTQRIRDELAKWAPIVREHGVKLD